MLENSMTILDKRKLINDLETKISFLEEKADLICEALDSFTSLKMLGAKFDLDFSKSFDFETYLCNELLVTDTELDIAVADLQKAEG